MNDSVSLPASYSEWLRCEYALRRARRERYSLRAFARDLGVSPPRLSRLMRGMEGLSLPAAREIVARLKWSRAQKDTFLNLVASERSAPSSTSTPFSESSLKRRYHLAADTAFQPVSQWYFMALLELVNVTDFRNDPQWIGQRLGISAKLADSAFRRLVTEGAIVWSQSRYRVEKNYFVQAPAAGSATLRSFHRQILACASAAIDAQTADHRELGTAVLAVDSQDIAAAKAMIRKFRVRFENKFQLRKRKFDKVYALGIQFFELKKAETCSRSER